MTFKSKSELLTAIPYIKEAPKKEAVIQNLCFRPKRNHRSFPDFLELTPNEGIKGDRWLESPWLKLSNGKPDPGIQVSILSTRGWDAVKFAPDAIPKNLDLSNRACFSFCFLSFLPDIVSTQPLKSAAFIHISATLGSTFALTAVGKARAASSGSSKRFIYFGTSKQKV